MPDAIILSLYKVLKAFTLERLTVPLPSQKIIEKHILHLKNAKLADPHFHIPDKIDIISGSDSFFLFYFTSWADNLVSK